MERTIPRGTPNTTDSTITPDEFPLGSEQNPAKDQAELPNGTGLVADEHGTKFWYKNGELHREGGPAVEYSGGSMEWHLNGVFHREDSPAIECSNGIKEYWLHGEYMNEMEFLERTKKNGKNEPKGDEKHILPPTLDSNLFNPRF